MCARGQDRGQTTQYRVIYHVEKKMHSSHHLSSLCSLFSAKNYSAAQKKVLGLLHVILQVFIEDLKKNLLELKSFKKWSICRQAQLCQSNGLKVTEVWSWCPKNLLGKKLTLATKKIELLVCQCFTSKQWEKHSKIHDHFEALRKTFQMRPCWMS